MISSTCVSLRTHPLTFLYLSIHIFFLIPVPVLLSFSPCNDQMVTTEHLTRRKSKKAATVASSKTTGLEQELIIARYDNKKLQTRATYLAQKMRTKGTEQFFTSMWRCSAREALRTWQRYHKAKGARLNKSAMALQWHHRRVLRRGFESFRVEKKQQVRVAELWRRKRRVAKRDVLDQWHDYLETRRRAGRLLGKIMSRAKVIACAPAFAQLKRLDVVHDGNLRIEAMREEANEELESMQSIVTSNVIFTMFRILIQNHKATRGRALRIWTRAIICLRKEEETRRRVATYLCGRSVMGAFLSWRLFLSRRKRARHLVTAVCLRNDGEAARYELIVGFQSFANNEAWCRGREEAAKRLGAFAYRGALAKMSSGLSLWYRATRATASQSSRACRLRRFDVRIKRERVKKVFFSWRIVAIDVLSKRRSLLGRILTRQRLTELGIASRRWQRNGARSVIGAKAVETVGRVLRQTATRIRRQGLNKWKMVTRRGRALSSRLLHREERRRGRVLASCWSIWCGEVDENSEQLRRAILAANKLTAGFRKRCLQKWRLAAVECIKERVILKRAAAKLLFRQVSSCFQIWSEYCLERQHARRLAGRVFRRLVDGQTLSCWNKWYHDVYLEGRRVDRVRADAMWMAYKSKANRWTRESFFLWRDDVREYVQLQNLMIKAGAKIRKLRMLSVFKFWQGRFRTAKHNRTVLMRAAMRIRNKSLVKSVGSWCDFMDRRDVGRIKIKKMCRLFLKCLKRLAIKRWRRFLKRLDQVDARKSVITAHLSRSMQKWKNRDKARVWNTWRMRVDEILKNRMLVQRAMMKWSMREVASCLERWIEYADTKVRHRRLLAKIRATWLKRLESKSFRSWTEFVERRRVVRNNMRKAFEKFKGKLSSQVFLAWKAVPVLRKRRQMIMARIVRRWRKSHITRGIGRWRTFTVAARILNRKKKPMGQPIPVVEEELSSESALVRRTLERGWMLTASPGIPTYDPLKVSNFFLLVSVFSSFAHVDSSLLCNFLQDSHATYAHTENFRIEQRRLKLLDDADRKASRMKFPGQTMLKELKEERNVNERWGDKMEGRKNGEGMMVGPLRH